MKGGDLLARVPDAPTPAIKDARQFFTPTGVEEFYSEAYGRRPDVKDALRVMGRGKTRMEAIVAAEKNWKRAWRSLHPTARVNRRVA